MVTIKKTKNNSILVEKRFEKKKNCAAVKTIAGIIKNLFIGVTQGYRYKMKLVYAHFPINATVINGGKGIEVRNYIGQKKVRRIDLSKKEETTKIVEPGTKDELWIEGNDINEVSEAASSIWQSCRVKDKDIRKFLDGIYVYSRGPRDDERPI